LIKTTGSLNQATKCPSFLAGKVRKQLQRRAPAPLRHLK
jgi:hypothetical protein